MIFNNLIELVKVMYLLMIIFIVEIDFNYNSKKVIIVLHKVLLKKGPQSDLKSNVEKYRLEHF